MTAQYEIAMRIEHATNCVHIRFRAQNDEFAIRVAKRPSLQETIDAIGEALQKEGRRLAEAEMDGDTHTPAEVAARAETIAMTLYEQLRRTQFSFKR